MIGAETARGMGVKFLREHGEKSMADELERDQTVCLDGVFTVVVKKFGKKGTKKLLSQLSKQLRNYVYYELLGIPDGPKEFEEALEGLYNDRPEGDRPERLKEFDSWMAEVEQTIMRYLDGKLLE